MSHVAFFLNILQILIVHFIWIHSNMLGIVNIKAMNFNYVNEPTSCTHFCSYLFHNFISTLHVSNDQVVHHQQFVVVYCIIQPCTIML